uniref:Uncharacterized protein n=1 Tax=Rhipicephalus zambeziensis TaxID=60191 RepID=A0A224Y739_9ACAR
MACVTSLTARSSDVVCYVPHAVSVFTASVALLLFQALQGISFQRQVEKSRNSSFARALNMAHGMQTVQTLAQQATRYVTASERASGARLSGRSLVYKNIQL